MPVRWVADLEKVMRDSIDWPLLKRDPQVGDVLMYAHNDMIVVVLRTYLEADTHPAVEVFWLTGGNDFREPTSIHSGSLYSWTEWHKLPVETTGSK